MTRRPDLPRFGDLREGGNMPPPERGNIRAGIALFVIFAGGIWIAHGFGF
jgi:hypothetical protein